jgi:Protein of unknown function (DUF2795)
MNGTSWAHVQEALSDLDFPARKDEIVSHARQRGDEKAERLLKTLPPETYQNISEIRSSVHLDPAADDGQTPARKAEQARSGHSRQISEHLREVGET